MRSETASSTILSNMVHKEIRIMLERAALQLTAEDRYSLNNLQWLKQSTAVMNSY